MRAAPRCFKSLLPERQLLPPCTERTPFCTGRRLHRAFGTESGRQSTFTICLIFAIDYGPLKPVFRKRDDVDVAAETCAGNRLGAVGAYSADLNHRFATVPPDAPPNREALPRVRPVLSTFDATTSGEA